MLHQIIDVMHIIDLITSFYINRFLNKFSEICLIIADHFYQKTHSELRGRFFDILEIALGFQDSISFMIDEKKKSTKLFQDRSNKLSISAPKRMEFYFNSKSISYSYDNFVKSIISNLSIEVLFVIGEFCSDLFSRNISFELFVSINNGMSYIFTLL